MKMYKIGQIKSFGAQTNFADADGAFIASYSHYENSKGRVVEPGWARGCIVGHTLGILDSGSIVEHYNSRDKLVWRCSEFAKVNKLLPKTYQRVFDLTTEVEPTNENWLVRCFINGTELESRYDDAWAIFDTESEARAWAKRANVEAEKFELYIANVYSLVESDVNRDDAYAEQRERFVKSVLEG